MFVKLNYTETYIMFESTLATLSTNQKRAIIAFAVLLIIIALAAIAHTVTTHILKQNKQAMPQPAPPRPPPPSPMMPPPAPTVVPMPQSGMMHTDGAAGGGMEAAWMSDHADDGASAMTLSTGIPLAPLM